MIYAKQFLEAGIKFFLHFYLAMDNKHFSQTIAYVVISVHK